MPPIILHLGIAREVAQALPHPALHRHLGSFYLGTTAPDIRLLTGSQREETHFSDLAPHEMGTGAKGLFLAYPSLVQDSAEATRAFVAGYLSHLVTDEVWISRIYHPYFSDASPAHMDTVGLAPIMDRALQYELDLRERDPEVMASIRQTLEDSGEPPAIPFIHTEALVQWRDFVVAATRREPSWERFISYARDFLVEQGKVSREMVEAFLADFTAMRERTLNHVAAGELLRFRQESVTGSIAAAREYLG